VCPVCGLHNISYDLDILAGVLSTWMYTVQSHVSDNVMITGYFVD
jgi:hypothetical protein